MWLPVFDKWRSHGVKLERSDTSGEITVYFISVPSMSEFYDDKGNELSGMLLAKRVKRELGDSVQVRCRVRQERWTQARAVNTECQPPHETITDNLFRVAREAENRQKEENLRAFFEGLFGGKL